MKHSELCQGNHPTAQRSKADQRNADQMEEVKVAHVETWEVGAVAGRQRFVQALERVRRTISYGSDFL